MLHLIGFIITGFIIGLIARAFKPGEDNMGIGLTTLLGIAGALIAGFIGRAFGWYGPDEGAGFILAVLGAISVIYAYYSFTHRKIGH